jgi:hypothetical protein
VQNPLRQFLFHRRKDGGSGGKSVSKNNVVVRAALGAAIVSAAIVATAGTATADAPQQAAPVYCTWGGDGPLAQQDCDNNGAGSGSASGSGNALGHFLGRLLFGGQ